MTKQAAEDKFLKELRRRTLSLPDKRQTPELVSKIHKYMQSLTENESSKTLSTKTAVLVYSLVRSLLDQDRENSFPASVSLIEEGSLPALCLNLLMKNGKFGFLLTAGILAEAKIPENEIQLWLEELPEKEALAVSGILMLLSNGEPAKVNPALSLISKASKMPADKAALFLKDSAAKNERIPFALIDAFMTGAYGEQCSKALNLPESMEEIITFAESIPPYTDHELIEALSIHLKSGDVRCMRSVLEALDRIASAPAEMISKALIPQTVSPTPFLSAKAIQLLARFKTEKTPVFLAELFVKEPKLRASIINRLPHLDLISVKTFLKKIDPQLHKTIIAAVFTLISEVDPGGAELHLDKILNNENLEDVETAEAVTALKNVIKASPLEIPEETEELQGLEKPGADFLKSGNPIVINVEQTGKAKGFRRIFGKATKNDDHSALELYRDEKFINQKINRINRWKCGLSELHFTDCSFTASDFRESHIYGCDFNFCVFKSCTFDEAVFSNCHFTDCEFESCNMDASRLDQTVFLRCTMEGCSFDRSVTSKSYFIETLIKASSLKDIFIHDSRHLRASFDACDLSRARIQLCVQSGIEYRHTILEDTIFVKSKVASSTFTECCSTGCLADSVDSQSAVLLGAESTRFMKLFDKREQDGAPIKPPSFQNKKVNELITKTVRSWLENRDIKRRLQKFAANNSRRISWALEKFEPKARDLFLLIPYLLHTDILEQFFEMKNPPVRTIVAGYQPVREVLNLSEDYFPDLIPGKAGKNPVVIETILTIGSVGTMSQSAGSDIDYWICCNLSEVDTVKRKWLELRFQLLEEWAMQQLNVEIHFFLMDVADVRNNNFGMSDAESSGSAQGAILKEEFYRSALLVAGKPPLWWFVPPEADDRTYREYASLTRNQLGKDAAVDLGHVPRIPGEEFFGAALWQIVKGIKSPFKSIMKFGLLERYTAGDKKTLLCETIKRNILEGHKELDRVDPYMLLYKEIADFYSKQGLPENVWLAGMSLKLKSGMISSKTSKNLPIRSEERELLNFNVNDTQGTAGTKADSDNVFTEFSSVLNLGQKINLFMIETYGRVNQKQDDSLKTLISPEDTTKLGRKISATFVDRRHKITRLLLPGDKKDFFTSIQLSRSDTGKWILQGEYPDPTGARNLLTDVSADKNLLSILTWFALNRLYQPEMMIKTDMSSAPVRKRDIKELMNSLCDFFPYKETFDTPIEEMLNQERMLKVFFIVNMTSPREHSEIDSINAVYSTNWGEVFCRPLAVSKKLIENPADYLCGKMAEICPEPPEMTQFLPAQAQCPQMNINKNSLKMDELRTTT
jgi:adenylate cyclase class 1